MENAMLTFDNVSAHYGKIQALHNVSLHIKQGEIVTLIGANGAGKTTLLGTLCGDPRASSGRIVFDGKDITMLPFQSFCVWIRQNMARHPTRN